VGCNGYFELSSNRRDVWCDSDDLAGDGAIRARWNKALMRDVCAPCFIRILLRVAAMETLDFFYNLFPRSSTCSSTWRPVLLSFYKIVPTIPMFPVLSQDEKLTRPLRLSEVVFADEIECPKLITQEIIKLTNLAIVRLQSDVVHALESNIQHIRIVKSAFVRKFWLSKLCKSSEAYSIFDFAIRDVRGRDLATFYLNQVLKSAQMMDAKNRDSIFLQLLRSSSLFRFDDVGLKHALQSVAFVPRGGDDEGNERELARPSELFTPKSTELKDLMSEKDFPSSQFCENDVLGSLVELGLRSTISRDDMLNIAGNIATRARNCEKEKEANLLAQRSARLVEYIVTKEKELNLRRRKESVGLFSFFKLGNGDKERAEKQRQIDHKFFTLLRKIEFLPVLLESPMKDLPWCAKTFRFCAPNEVRPRRDMMLCSATKSISALNADEMQDRIFGWDNPVDAVTLGLQLVSFARMHDTVSDELCDVVRTIYKKLNDHVLKFEKENKEDVLVTPSSSKHDETIERVKFISVLYVLFLFLSFLSCFFIHAYPLFLSLSHTHNNNNNNNRSDTAWILVNGNRFAKPTCCAFTGLQIPPYLFTVSSSSHAKDLFRKFGVRDKFFTSDYVSALKSMSSSKITTHNMIDTSIQIANRLSDDPSISDFEIFLPDTTGAFVPSSELFVDDMSWRQNKGNEHRLVHEKIGLKVARRLGVKSLRESLVLNSSESFGVPFGQKECLTRRLSNILEQYPQGITPLLEFIQNADDAGARNVKIVFSTVQFGEKSLISKDMKSWQGMVGALSLSFSHILITTNNNNNRTLNIGI